MRSHEDQAPGARFSPAWFVAVDETRRSAALREIQSRPIDYVVGTVIRSVKLWIGIWQKDWPPWLALLARTSSVPIFLLALIGTIALARRREGWIFLVPPLYLTATHMWIHAEARFSYPIRGCLLILAAIGLSMVCERIFSRSRPAR